MSNFKIKKCILFQKVKFIEMCEILFLSNLFLYNQFVIQNAITLLFNNYE